MNPIKAFYNSINGKRVAVVGVGVSNTPLIELLINHGAKVTACDKRSKEELGETYARLFNSGVTFFCGEDYLDHFDHDIIFKTPGLRFDAPQLLAAKKAGALVTSEMEAFFELCPCPIIAVTGSDGKTTTTSIIAEMLRAEGKKVFLGGNIGKPLLPEIDLIRADDAVVVELSSFQLHTMKQSPHIAVITNVAPNHLDWHTGMEEYIAAKKNLIAFQTQQDRAVLNEENEITKDFCKEVKGECCTFSLKKPVSHGYYLQNGSIICSMGQKPETVLDRSEIKIVGMHNVDNYMAAMAALEGLVSHAHMRQVAKSFGGVEHRIEFVRELDGVKYYNDSIASSPTRTIAGLHSFAEKVILIAGGYDKKIPFDTLGEEIPAHVKLLILTGATSGQIETAVKQASTYHEGEPAIMRCENMEQAVKVAHMAAKPGDVVTLSPACAAFDAYPNFAVRGTKYKELVNSLK